MLLVSTFCLDAKGCQKIKDNPNRSARLSGQRLHISLGALFTGEVIVGLTIGLVDEVDTVKVMLVAFGIGWWHLSTGLDKTERDDLSLGWKVEASPGFKW